MAAFSRQHVHLIRDQRSRAALVEAREALMGYAAAHGRLPRPAITPADGNEALLPCAARGDCSGYIPWRLLGIDPTSSTEALLRYTVTPAFTAASVSRSDTIADNVVKSSDHAGREFFVYGKANCDLHSCAPAVLFLQEPDVSPIFPQTSALTAANEVVRPLDRGTQPGPRYLVRRSGIDHETHVGQYSNQVVWIPVDTLFKRMALTGVLN